MANCVCDIYTTAEAAQTAINLIEDTKWLGTVVIKNVNTSTEKILVIHKA